MGWARSFISGHPARLEAVKSFNELTALAESSGVSVFYGPVSRPGVAGFYCETLRVIFVDSRLYGGLAVAVLGHELVHAWRGDVGCQDEAVEARVDEDAAWLIIDVEEYARAEMLCDGLVGAMACELGVPAWLVDGFRRGLERGRAGSGVPRVSHE